MNLRFRSLHICGFKSIVEPLTLRLDRRGLHFVKAVNYLQPQLGSNDSGKSTIWQALTWALYGRTADNLRNPDIVPWPCFGFSGQSKVTVDFLCDDAAHRLERTTNPNSLRLDDEVVGQQQVDSLLRMSFELFINAVMFAQGRPLFFDLTASEKMKLLSSVLRLDDWDARAEHASERARSVETDLLRQQDQLIALQAQIDITTAKSIECEQRWQSWEQERNTRRDELARQMAELQRQLATVRGNRDKADLELESAGLEVTPLQNRIRLGRAEHVEQQEMVRRESTGLAQLEAHRRRVESALHLLASDNCPTCGQAILPSNNLQRTYKSELAKLKAQIISSNSAVEKLTAQAGTIMQQVVTDENSLQQFMRRADAARDLLNQLSPRCAALETKLRGLQEQHDGSEAETNPHEKYRRELNADIERFCRQHDKSNRRHLALQAYLSRVQFWSKEFKRIKLQLVDDVLQELELFTNAALADSGLPGWEVRYQVERENKSGTIKRELNVLILSPQNDSSVKWEAWGGGVGQRLRLIGALALGDVLTNRAGVSVDLTVLDEPTQHLSAEGITDLVELLAERAISSVVFLVDHAARESAYFASTIEITKSGTGTILS
jgi:DNA repair exonuclease SbcCD ATPase subunit